MSSVAAEKDEATAEVGEEMSDSIDIASLPEIDRLPMNENRRFLLKVIMIIRFTFRGYFGLKFSNRWGFFVDRHMCSKIHRFAWSLDIPTGDRSIKHTVIKSLVFSSDGCYFFISKQGKMSITAWDRSQWKPIKEWVAHDYQVECLAYHSGRLVSGSDDCTIRIWNAKTYELIQTLNEHVGRVNNLAFNSKGDRLVSCGLEGWICLWSVDSGVCLNILRGHVNTIYAVHWVDNTIISSSRRSMIKLWDSSTGCNTRNIEDDYGEQFWGATDLIINCDKSIIVYVLYRGFIVFNMEKDTKQIVHKQESVSYAAFHPFNPNILAILERQEQLIKIYDIQSDNYIHSFEAPRSMMYGIKFTADARQIVCLEFGNLLFFDVPSFS